MSPAVTGMWSQLPPGREIRLAGGRTTFVRELPGPQTAGSAPALFLLHGLMLTADLNWFGSLETLGDHYRVVTMDLPGHGHSPARGRRPSLSDCADQVAEVAAALDISAIVPVGYSMGGLVAQLVWERHRELVAGMVLCCTARNFRGSLPEQMTSLLLPGLTSWMQLNPVLHLMGSGAIGMNMLGHIPDPELARWANQQMEQTSLATTTAAIDEVSRFSSHSWIGAADVPCAVVVTTRDHVVPASRQRRLAAAIPGATVHEIDAGHGVCVSEPARFAQTLLRACHSVATSREAAR